MLQADVDKAEKRAVLAEQIYDYFKDTSASEREHEYFERILDFPFTGMAYCVKAIGLISVWGKVYTYRRGLRRCSFNSAGQCEGLREWDE